jgi:hypothetical protein
LQQSVLFASEDGQAAVNVSTERTGLYYRELQTIIDRLSGWPPDPEAINRAHSRKGVKQPYRNTFDPLVVAALAGRS